MTTQTTTYRCDCGAITGVPCDWSGPVSDMVVVEHMPEYLRASHEAARNRGCYPANGATRIAVARSCADDLADDWTQVIAADPSRYAAA